MVLNTAVSYKNKKFDIKRYDSETDYYDATGGHYEGVFLELEICNEDEEDKDEPVLVLLSSVLEIIGEKSDMRNIWVHSDTAQSLRFSVGIPLEKL